jgi:hypothetical protein
MANESQFSDQTWDELLNLIELQKVVPIVGRALSLADMGDGRRGLAVNAVVERLAPKLSIAPRDPPWTLSELFVESARQTLYSADSFHLMLRKELDAAKPAPGPLQQLAEIRDFRLFLSTALDGFLEQAVAEIRGATGEPVHTITFAPDGYYDLPGRLQDMEGVTIFKLLGGRETCPNWAVTVENSLEFVIALHSEKYRPVNLLDAIKESHLLAIGCQIPDWLGRFFLRCLRGGPISAQRATNFLVENIGDADTAFQEYLRQFSKSSFVVPGNAADFVEELHRRWKQRQGPDTGARHVRRPEPSPTPPAAHKVFLSYSHRDRSEAERLYRFLQGKRIDVWKDDEGGLDPGAKWEAEINRRIADCSCFVPLVTRNAMSDSDSFFWAEWKSAVDRTRRQDPNRRFIFPVRSDRGLALPDMFSAMQATLLSDPVDMDRLADALRKEQQRLRKEDRASA